MYCSFASGRLNGSEVKKMELCTSSCSSECLRSVGLAFIWLSYIFPNLTLQMKLKVTFMPGLLLYAFVV